MLKKIVVIGPESTGKSNLCAALATQYNTLWCPEYAREYLLKNGTNYSYDNLLSIAKGQLNLEDAFTKKADEQSAPLLFIDTDMYVMKVWCEFVFGKCHQFILDEIHTRKYDLYLLCDTDLPWEKDALREYPDNETRNNLFQIYRNLLEKQQTPWAIVNGTGNDRTQNAINAINHLLK